MVCFFTDGFPAPAFLFGALLAVFGVNLHLRGNDKTGTLQGVKNLRSPVIWDEAGDLSSPLQQRLDSLR